MIRSRRRLQLSSETVRVLGAPALRGVAAGFGQVPTGPVVVVSDSCQTTTMVPTIVPTTTRCQ